MVKGKYGVYMKNCSHLIITECSVAHKLLTNINLQILLIIEDKRIASSSIFVQFMIIHVSICILYLYMIKSCMQWQLYIHDDPM